MQEFFGLAYFGPKCSPCWLTCSAVARPPACRRVLSSPIFWPVLSHGDTKHVLLFPEDAYESFTLTAQAFDLAERPQTPVFVMLDPDIGMNDRLCKPFDRDDSRRYDRGKSDERRRPRFGKTFRSLFDVDGDGIPYRTIPATHPNKGAQPWYDTQRLCQVQRETGADYVQHGAPASQVRDRQDPRAGACDQESCSAARAGVIYYGSTSPAMDEAFVLLAKQGVHVDLPCVRGFPLC